MKRSIFSTLLLCTATFTFSFAQPNFSFDEVLSWFRSEKRTNKKVNELYTKFAQNSPISTTFDDAKYEADVLQDFEPQPHEYQSLALQPSAGRGAYKLSSGLYTMNAKSFCLRGYTYGPSKGDGHLYAPLKGRQANFIRAIIERFSTKPNIAQREVQVLLWAIIAGANMETIGDQYKSTLSKLFTPKELLTYYGKGIITGTATKYTQKFKKRMLKKFAPQLEKMMEADQKISRMVKENKSFNEIENIAVLAGVAPAKDMIREVTAGRWSYLPKEGYFIRFFPRGYPQTRVDIYVPYEGEVQVDKNKKVTAIRKNSRRAKKVTYRPSTMTAMPANRSSQRIGISSVPVRPVKDEYTIVFYAFDKGDRRPESKENPTIVKSGPGHIYIAFAKNDQIEQVKGLSPKDGVLNMGVVNSRTDECYLMGFHRDFLAVKVSERKYRAALNINRSYYFSPISDCVSYGAEVAQSIGLNTPNTTDLILYPYTYLKYLKRKNRGSACSWCNDKDGFTCRMQ